MKQEELKRLRRAYQYQKMAIQALLPDKTAKHLEIITNELKSMILEGVADCLSGTRNGNETQKYSSQGWTTSKKEESGSLSQEAKETKPDKFSVQPEKKVPIEKHSNQVKKISIQ